MAPLYLTRADVETLCEKIDVEQALAGILIAGANGNAGQMVRRELAAPELSGVMGIMPAYCAEPTSRFSAKVVCVLPGNPAKGLPAHQGVAMIFDGKDGHLIGMAEAGAVTEARTSALAALATRTLCDDSKPLRSLVVGSGHQALPHLRALSRVPGISAHAIWGRRKDAAREIAVSAAAHGLSVEVESELEEAVGRADVVTLVTGASSPVIQAAWLKQGVHVNAMGSSTPHVCEFGEDLVGVAKLFVDSADSVLSLAGEFVKLAGPPRLNELGAVLAGITPAANAAEEITLFKSVGVALQDLAILDRLMDVARDNNTGQKLSL